MTDPLIAQIAHAICSFVSSVFMKGSEEIGKNIAKDVYDKVKKVFKKDNSSLSNLQEQPKSKQYQECFENDLAEVLTQSNSFPRDIAQILTTMSVDAAILETMFKSYKKLKYEHDLHYIAWTDSTSESGEDLQEIIKGLERKMYILNGRVMLMFKNVSASSDGN